MNRFIFLLLAAALLPCSCISVNTADQTRDASTVYRTWQSDRPAKAWIKDDYVYVKVRQSDQHKDTPVIGCLGSSRCGNKMTSIPGTEMTAFLKIHRKDLTNTPTGLDMTYCDQQYTVITQFSTRGAKKFHLALPKPTIKSIPTLRAQQIIQQPSTARKALAGVQTILIDYPGTIVANVLVIPVGLAVSPFVGIHHLFTR